MNKESKMWAEEKLKDILKRLALNADECGDEKFDWFEWVVIHDIVQAYAKQHGINCPVYACCQRRVGRGKHVRGYYMLMPKAKRYILLDMQNLQKACKTCVGFHASVCLIAGLAMWHNVKGLAFGR